MIDSMAETPSYRQQRTRRKWVVREKYGLTPKQFCTLTPALMNQLDACTTEEARRILLGKSK